MLLSGGMQLRLLAPGWQRVATSVTPHIVFLPQRRVCMSDAVALYDEADQLKNEGKLEEGKEKVSHSIKMK